MSIPKPWPCRLGIHRWHDAHNDDGERCSLCLRCGTTKDEVVLLEEPRHDG
ncbi:MAG: hypothetical protein HOQ45_09485 [Nocardioidaceae bacterium]|nr:hypothetical protein [Nocardioidaceae bacterium]